MGSRGVLGGSGRGSTMAGLEPDFGTGRAERGRHQWLMLTAQLYCYAEAWRLRHRPPETAPRSGPGAALTGGILAVGAARRALQAPPSPAALGLAGASAHARPLHTRRDRSSLWRAHHRHPLDQQRRRALARPGPRPRPVPQGNPENHHRRLPHRPATKASGRWRFAGGWTGQFRRGFCRIWFWLCEVVILSVSCLW